MTAGIVGAWLSGAATGNALRQAGRGSAVRETGKTGCGKDRTRESRTWKRQDAEKQDVEKQNMEKQDMEKQNVERQGMKKQGTEEKKKRRLTIQDIALMGMMVAVIEACKAAMAFLPNIELTSFWIILFTLLFRWRILFVIPVFILVEGAMYGFGLWWVMYLYAWPLLALAAYVCSEQKSVWFWSFLSAMFGFSFGLLCAIPYVVIGMADGIRSGLHAGFVWWVAGIPFDIAHGVGNFVLMAVLYKPVRQAMKRIMIEKSEEP